MAYAWLCDFDGTISPTDIGAALVHRFARAQGRLEQLYARWRAGEIGHRELTVAECAELEMTEQEALAFVRGVELDPHFAAFVAERQTLGEPVRVASEGLHFYIRDRLEHAGLGDLPWSSNVARFEGRRVRPEFPNAARGCGRCGNCKGEHVRDLQKRGHEVVFVGDGISDRCGASAADRVIARGSLLEWCAIEGVAAEPFRDFADVSTIARALPRHGRAQV